MAWKVPAVKGPDRWRVQSIMSNSEYRALKIHMAKNNIKTESVGIVSVIRGFLADSLGEIEAVDLDDGERKEGN